MKYIDAELLREKIAEQIELLPREVGKGAGTITSKGYGMIQAFQIMRSIIDSLQQDETQVDKMLCFEVWWQEQGWIMIPPNATIKGIDSLLKQVRKKLQDEQPEVDLVAELKHHLTTTPKEQLEKEWRELKPWGNIGPTVQEFLYGKQPEVDLDKELENYAKENPMEDAGSYRNLINIAHHFYRLGLKTRK